MSKCTLLISGINFTVSKFLRTSSLKAHVVSAPVEMATSVKAFTEDAELLLGISDDHPSAGLNHSDEALRFLCVYEPELQRAKRFGAKAFRLIFSGQLVGGNKRSQYLPPKLLLLAGRLNIGIEMSHD